MPTATAHLQAARDLLTPEAAWTQLAMARDKFGGHTAANSREAVCWCSMGALHRTGRTLGQVTSMDTVQALNRVVGEPIGLWQDQPGRTHAEVLAAFDAAIALVEQTEATPPRSER